MAPVFEYEARNRDGEKKAGTLHVDNSSQAARQLREKGYYVTYINQKQDKKTINNFFKLSGRVRTRELALFSQQFAAMIDAGINLVDALNILSEQIEQKKLQMVITGLREDIETGSGLAEAMFKYSDVFPELYCQMIMVGESGGVLDKVLNKLAAHYERQDEINGKIRSGLYYPVTILLVAVAVIIFLLTAVVPQFVSIFSMLGGMLPLPTRIMLMLSDFMRLYWWIVFLFFIITGLILLRYRKTEPGELKFDSLILKIPVFGRMMKKIYLSRITSTLAILLESGIDLLSGLNIVENVVGNKIYTNILHNTAIQVREGVPFSRPLSVRKEFPPMVVQMIKVGEEAGFLEEMLKKVSSFYEREVEASIDATISLIEPALIIILALVVGFIVISIVMPMFDMYQYL
jgi:type IV pilus assembly protein PilC